MFEPVSGFGKIDSMEDCSIGVTHCPGVVTVKFSTLVGETYLVIDPDYAETIATWLLIASKRAVEKSIEEVGDELLPAPYR